MTRGYLADCYTEKGAQAAETSLGTKTRMRASVPESIPCLGRSALVAGGFCFLVWGVVMELREIFNGSIVDFGIAVSTFAWRMKQAQPDWVLTMHPDASSGLPPDVNHIDVWITTIMPTVGTVAGQISAHRLPNNHTQLFITANPTAWPAITPVWDQIYQELTKQGWVSRQDHQYKEPDIPKSFCRLPWHETVIRMYFDKYPVPDIAKHVNMSAKSVGNYISEVRKVRPDLVPRRQPPKRKKS